MSRPLRATSHNSTEIPCAWKQTSDLSQSWDFAAVRRPSSESQHHPHTWYGVVLCFHAGG